MFLNICMNTTKSNDTSAIVLYDVRGPKAPQKRKIAKSGHSLGYSIAPAASSVQDRRATMTTISYYKAEP